MKKKYTKETKEFKMMTAWWTWVQDFAEPESSDEWWKDFLDSAKALMEESHNDIFIEKMCMAYIDVMEDKNKQREENKTNEG